jgi:4,5-DOPA dioxygenase extradiol
MRMPVLFIGHGSPMNIIADNDFTRSLVKLGKDLPKPRAILVVSAHWLTEGTFVTCEENPKTIHDFGGFPEELYRIHYPSPGSPADARLITEKVKTPALKCSTEWGLDHASWAILKHMYPKADIPVIEMSLDYPPYNDGGGKTLRYYYDLAKQLTFLREKNVLIIGSGNIVHNLNAADYEYTNVKPFDWAVEFDEQVKRNLQAGNHEALLDFHNLTPAKVLSAPTLDHYMPMIFAIALQEKNDDLTFTYEGFQNASVSMRCFKIG